MNKFIKYLALIFIFIPSVALAQQPKYATPSTVSCGNNPTNNDWYQAKEAECDGIISNNAAGSVWSNVESNQQREDYTPKRVGNACFSAESHGYTDYEFSHFDKPNLRCVYTPPEPCKFADGIPHPNNPHQYSNCPGYPTSICGLIANGDGQNVQTDYCLAVPTTMSEIEGDSVYLVTYTYSSQQCDPQNHQLTFVTHAECEDSSSSEGGSSSANSSQDNGEDDGGGDQSSSTTNSNSSSSTSSSSSSSTPSSSSSSSTPTTTVPDTDNDGTPDDQDDDIDGDGTPNNEDDDIDGDGIPNDEDPTPEGTGAGEDGYGEGDCTEENPENCGDSEGQGGDCEGTDCGEGAASEFCEEDEECLTVQEAFEKFQEGISELELVDKVGNFLSYGGGGTCPTWSVSAWDFTLVFDQFCSTNIPWSLIYGIIVATAAFISFRIAFT